MHLSLLRSPLGRALLAAIVALAAVVVVRQARDGAGEPPPPPIVAEAWSRPTPPGIDVTAVYLELHADGDDALVGVAVDPAFADAVGIHRNTIDDAGRSSMEHLERIELPAGETVALTPAGALHLMVEGLAVPLVDGDRFELTFTFVGAGEVPATVVVTAGR